MARPQTDRNIKSGSTRAGKREWISGAGFFPPTVPNRVVSLLARRRLRPPRVPWGPGKRSADYDDGQLPDVPNADQHDVGDDQ